MVAKGAAVVPGTDANCFSIRLFRSTCSASRQIFERELGVVTSGGVLRESVI